MAILKDKKAKDTATGEVFAALRAKTEKLIADKARQIEHCNARIAELEEQRSEAAKGTSIAAGNDEFVRASKELKNLDEDIAFFRDRIRQLDRAALSDEEINAEAAKVRAEQSAIVAEGLEAIMAELKKLGPMYEPIFEQIRSGDNALAAYKSAAGKSEPTPSYYSDERLTFLQNVVGRFLIQLRHSPYFKD